MCFIVRNKIKAVSVMRRKLLILFMLMMMILYSSCQKNPDRPDLSTIPPDEEPALGGIMREEIPETESETDEVIPIVQSKSWLNYGGIKDAEFPETEHIRKLEYNPKEPRISTDYTQIEKITCMVGSIEQRFYECVLSDAVIEKISDAWERFSGEILNAENLTCMIQDKKIAFQDVLEQDYSEIEMLSYNSGDYVLTYDIQNQSLNISRKDFPENPVSVYTQSRSLWHVPGVVFLDAESNNWNMQSEPDDSYLSFSDAVMLDGEEVSLWELERTARDFLYTVKYYDTQLNQQISPFYTPDYKTEGFRTEIQTFADGNQAVYFRMSFSSRDMPILSGTDISSGMRKQVTGTELEIGMFRKEEIGCIRTNYFLNEPTQIQITDPRPKMEGIPLLDMESAFQLADASLSEIRYLKTAKLQYATEKIFDSRNLFQGYVLTPVWHFVFAPSEEEIQQGCSAMMLTVDAITGEVFLWYDTAPEHSGDKCWITPPDSGERPQQN